MLLHKLASSDPVRLLRKRDFSLLWVGETVSQIGDGLNKVALLWFVYQTQHSALKTSIVGVLQTVPPLILGPLIGAYLDRARKKPVMLGVSLLHGALVAAMPVLYALGLLDLGWLYALVFLTSVVASLYGPALMLAVPLIVEPGELRAANALIQSTGTIGVLLGPVAAGVCISLLGIANVLYVDAATFLFFVGCAWFVRVREADHPRERRAGVGEFAKSLRDGLLFMLRRQTGVLFLTLVAGLENIGASAFLFLLPTLAKQNFSSDSLSLGLFWSAFGAGMLGATALIAFFKADQQRGLLRLVLTSLALGGLSVVALAYVKARIAAAVLMTIIGFSAASFNPVVITLLQQTTPEDLRGRVLTTFNTANMAMAMFGMLVFGWSADRVGEDPTMIAVGAVLISTAFALMLVSRASPARQLLAGT